MRFKGFGLRIGNKDKGFYHTTPTFNTNDSLHPLSRITLFGGHCKILNFPLEDDLQLFPGLKLNTVIDLKHYNHLPQTFRTVLDIVGDLIYRLV